MTEKSLAKPFEPMLASPRGKLIFPCMVQPKYDGIRCVVRNGQALTRNLEPIPNMLIRTTLSNALFEGFDGELIAGVATAKDVYNATQDVVMDANADPSNVAFHVFDDFSDPRRPYQLRFLGSQGRVKKIREHMDVICSVPCAIADNEDNLQQLVDPLFDMGYEGAIVRAMQAIYKHGRATESEGSLWKIKRMQDDECEIIRCEERMHNENEAEQSNTGKMKRGHSKAGMKGTGMLGVLVGINDALWPGQEIRIGSSNLPKMKLDAASKHFVGKLVTFKHQPAGAKDAPRFPIYKGVRDPRDL